MKTMKSGNGTRRATTKLHDPFEPVGLLPRSCFGLDKTSLKNFNNFFFFRCLALNLFYEKI